MPFNSDILQDASLQQLGEDLQVWEPAGFTNRQDSLAGGYVQKYHRIKEKNDQDDLDLNRSHEHGVDRLLPVKVEQEEMYEPVCNLQQDIADQELQISETRSGGPPTWLSTAALRQPNHSLNDRKIASRHAGRETETTEASQSESTHTHWFSVQGTGVIASSSQLRPVEEHGRKASDPSELGINRLHKRMATELNLMAAHGRSGLQQSLEPTRPSYRAAAASRSYPQDDIDKADRDTARQDPEWEEMRKRCLIVTHPLFPQMLANHVACLRAGTPVEQLPNIEAQMIKASQVTEPYRVLRDQINDVTPDEEAELDGLMRKHTSTLGSFKGTLEHHVRTVVTDALMSCWDIELELYDLTGARPEPGNGPTMSDDDDEVFAGDYGSYDQGIDCKDVRALGPLEPSESERSLMERVRQELKLELKQGYKTKLEDVREEILRKRRAGKLPDGTTAILKNWWDTHAMWPYPTEDDKEILIQQTGLELKQVNNWFINQRKRNWQGHPMNPRTGQAVDSKGKARKSW